MKKSKSTLQAILFFWIMLLIFGIVFTLFTIGNLFDPVRLSAHITAPLIRWLFS